MPGRSLTPALPDQRVDERDTMFARAARRPGTPAYDDYYARRGDLRRLDDRIRALPELMHPGGAFYDEEVCREARQWSDGIAHLSPDPATVAAWHDRLTGTTDGTAVVRELVLDLGAVAAGCAGLPEWYVYSHKGRFDEDYGREIVLEHDHVLVFLVEMDHGEMSRAPRAEAVRESTRQYYRAAAIAKTAEAVIRAAGFAAKAHYDAHYDVILPPLAVLAGLGELGRNNILVADRHGSRVRIGAVTTDLPLRHDAPVSLGVQHFCETCKKCADNCPSRALSQGERTDVRGIAKWPTDVERCYNYWRVVGTDCGICMAVCPFSHRDNAFHGLVRRLVRTVPSVRRLALLGDDLVYGRRWRPLQERRHRHG